MPCVGYDGQGGAGSRRVGRRSEEISTLRYFGDSAHGSAAAERRSFFRQDDFSVGFRCFALFCHIVEWTMRHRCCSLLAYCTHSLVTSTVSVPVLIVGVWLTRIPPWFAAGGVFAEGNAGGGTEAPPRGAPSGAKRGGHHGRTRGCPGPARHNEGAASQHST